MTNDNAPIDLNAKRMQRGESMFFCCPCGTDGGWFAVCILTANGPVVTNLVCSDCAAVSAVEYGRVSMPEASS